MDRYLNLLFESNNNIFEIGKKSACRLLSIDGLASVENEINVENNSNYDGGYTLSKRIPIKNIFIEAEVINNKEITISDSDLIKYFNPKFKGKLIIDNSGEKKTINYEIENFKIIRKGIFDPLVFQLSLICVNPFFEDLRKSEVLFSSIKDYFMFPTELVEAGLELSVVDNIEIKDIENGGDVESPISVEFIANGYVKNPYLENSKLESIKLNLEMNSGDRIFVTTDYGNKNVRLHREGEVDTNGLSYLDYKSTFIKLPLGTTRFRYGADAGKENLSVNLKYTKKYLGV